MGTILCDILDAHSSFIGPCYQTAGHVLGDAGRIDNMFSQSIREGPFSTGNLT
jgi:hypothetical protein